MIKVGVFFYRICSFIFLFTIGQLLLTLIFYAKTKEVHKQDQIRIFINFNNFYGFLVNGSKGLIFYIYFSCFDDYSFL
jgi:hypothetical protein